MRPITSLRRILACALLAVPSWALALDPPQGPVVLSVTGLLTQANVDGRVDLDMAQLKALPQHSFVVETPWFKGPQKFSGPLLRDILALAGARGSQIVAIALNDYKVTLPVDDARRWTVLVAHLLNDKPMSVREKGPLFIIYPYDESSELRSERYYSRAAWQLRRLEVK
jgi:hypothetical protein